MGDRAIKDGPNAEVELLPVANSEYPQKGSKHRNAGNVMSEIEKLLRDIHTLRESIQIDWDELYSNPLREEERREIRTHLELCQTELKFLIERLRAFEDDPSN